MFLQQISGKMCPEHVKIIVCGLKQVNKKSWILNLIQNLYGGKRIVEFLLLILLFIKQ